MRASRPTLGGACALAVAIALLAPVPAGADVIDVIRDCRDGVVNGRYTARELREAERNLPSDQVEYGDCADALRAAQLDARRRNSAGGDSPGGDTGAGGGAGGGGSGASATPADGATAAEQAQRSAEDQQALRDGIGQAGKGPAPELTIGGARVAPQARSGSDLPRAVVLAMIAAGLLGLAGAWQVTKRRLGAPLVSLRFLRR